MLPPCSRQHAASRRAREVIQSYPALQASGLVTPPATMMVSLSSSPFAVPTPPFPLPSRFKPPTLPFPESSTFNLDVTTAPRFLPPPPPTWIASPSSSLSSSLGNPALARIHLFISRLCSHIMRITPSNGLCFRLPHFRENLLRAGSQAGWICEMNMLEYLKYVREKSVMNASETVRSGERERKPAAPANFWMLSPEVGLAVSLNLQRRYLKCQATESRGEFRSVPRDLKRFHASDTVASQALQYRKNRGIKINQ